MNILHIIWATKFGGIERLVSDLCTLQNQSHDQNSEILIMHVVEDKDIAFDFKKLKLHFLNMKNGHDFSLKKFLFLKNITNSFDIVHIHSYNPFIAFSLSLLDIRVVYTEHGSFGFGRTKRGKENFLDLLKHKWISHSLSGIVYNSKFTKKESENRVGNLNNATKSKVIYNGTNFTKFSTVKLEHNDKFIIGTYGRLAKVKHIDRSLRAFSAFAKNKSDVQLIIVGNGEQDNILKKLSEDLNISDKVLFYGYSANVISQLKTCSITTITSSGEAFGLVAIESFAMGIPTLVMEDGGGLVEIVSEVEKQDVLHNEHELTQRMEFYYNNRSIIEKNAKSRKEYVFSNFTNEIMENNYYEFYKQILTC